ncbi:prolipoprotein diacylglyceryl transferase [Aquisalimonas asiatica]|uniref:Phosphatidylglycerol--prolipoprotein diacylglyceryl transferase n=1 Tax=Aquisalimonas asiatica TaxID=406100 RepID=A0A1H8T2U9_9GAMM|nr:prolipoprotein diacylglyceryl transferase [Aquisalimonas asiatica]SEO84853.1 phosphatidylglycerol:prolipoprotein diacylglycerol transferase [Aquisalimonas asiatica]
MLTYPDIDPVAIQLGPVAIHWYGLMYLIGFGAAWLLGRWRAQRYDSPIRPLQMEDVLVFGAIGAILGGRIGYVLFYESALLTADPLAIIRVWEGGMSFHGGLLGVLAGLWLYAKRTGCGFLRLTDFAAPLVPIGLGAGRIGNFINGELWGRASDVPWAMVYPPMGPDPRHPSQLYQFLLEGVVLFIALWLFTRKPRPTMAASGLFLVLYGSFRFIVEFVRLPDEQLGYLAFDWVTMGQVLSTPMILLGAALMYLAYRQTARYS